MPNGIITFCSAKFVEFSFFSGCGFFFFRLAGNSNQWVNQIAVIFVVFAALDGVWNTPYYGNFFLTAVSQALIFTTLMSAFLTTPHNTQNRQNDIAERVRDDEIICLIWICSTFSFKIPLHFVIILRSEIFIHPNQSFNQFC